MFYMECERLSFNKLTAVNLNTFILCKVFGLPLLCYTWNVKDLVSTSVQRLTWMLNWISTTVRRRGNATWARTVLNQFKACSFREQILENRIQYDIRSIAVVFCNVKLVEDKLTEPKSLTFSIIFNPPSRRFRWSHNSEVILGSKHHHRNIM